MIIIRPWMIYITLLVLMSLSTPDPQAHETKLEQILNHSMSELTAEQVTTARAVTPDFHNFYIFTYTSHNRRVLTFGALGIVFDARF